MVLQLWLGQVGTLTREFGTPGRDPSCLLASDSASDSSPVSGGVGTIGDLIGTIITWFTITRATPRIARPSTTETSTIAVDTEGLAPRVADTAASGTAGAEAYTTVLGHRRGHSKETGKPREATQLRTARERPTTKQACTPAHLMATTMAESPAAIRRGVRRASTAVGAGVGDPMVAVEGTLVAVTTNESFVGRITY